VSYTASILKVMIASPGDVPQERILIREVIHEWNAIHAEDRKILLQPVGWETHASPQMGERPQAIINKQVLQGCDVLVAAFWTRLGSPTGTSPSGTVEEIDEHIGAGKPALIYFSSAPVRMESVDPKQYEALTDFKRTCMARGLVEQYEDLAAFRTKFARHLAQTVIRFVGGSGMNDPPEVPAPSSTPALSSEAKELLNSAASASDGVVMQLNTLDGLYVQANDRNHVEPGNPRSEARWRAALRELVDAGLLEDRLGVGEVYNVTESGYRVSSTLGPDTSARGESAA
jgi:hypothetical protein